MIGEEDTPSTYEYENHLKSYSYKQLGYRPAKIKNGKKVGPNFIYNSETIDAWMTKRFEKWLSLNKDKLERFKINLWDREQKVENFYYEHQGLWAFI